MVVRSEFFLIISKKAQKEIERSYDWYEEQQRGLGDRFIKEVITFISKIQANLFHYSEKIKGLRGAPLKVFPFLMVFKINEAKSIIRIVAVFHTS